MGERREEWAASRMHARRLGRVLAGAIKKGDLQRVHGALLRGASPHFATRPHGRTPLHLAAEHGRRDVVCWLLARGADPAATALYAQTTALLLAVTFGHVEIAETLLQHGADPNQADNRGCSPLYAAVERRDLPLVRLLLNHGAHPDTARGWLGTPLGLALQRLREAEEPEHWMPRPPATERHRLQRAARDYRAIAALLSRR